MAVLHELEIGPHFITFYIKPKVFQELPDIGAEAYKKFLIAYPDLAEIQQKDFLHEENDPNVYHPFGEPNHFREAFRHFHIRFGRTPLGSEVAEALELVKSCSKLTTAPEFKTSALTNNRLPEFKGIPYPKISGREYLKYIALLRTGDWLKKDD